MTKITKIDKNLITATHNGEASGVKLPAGTYFLGDPCYAVTESAVWTEYVETAYDGNYWSGGAFINGFPVVALSTMYGDGAFPITGVTTLSTEKAVDFSKISSIPVDSGLIGLTDLRASDVQDSILRSMGLIISFDSEVTFTCDNEGLMSINSVDYSIRIVTGDEEEDSADDDEDFDDEKDEDFEW